MVRTKICLASILLYLVILVTTTAILMVYGKGSSLAWTLVLTIAVLTSLFLFMMALRDLFFGDGDISVFTRCFVRPLAARYFYKIFSIYPPQKRDRLTREFYNEKVDAKLKALRNTIDDCCNTFSEKKRDELPQDNRLEYITDCIPRVKTAITIYENALWLASFFY